MGRIARVREQARERFAEPRTIWQALADPGFLVSRWPWRSMAYLGTGMLYGAGAMVLLFSLISVGLVLSLVLVGMPLLAAVCLAGLPVGALERRRIRWISFEPVPDPHAAVTRPGFAAWLRTRLSEQATWRELGYAFILCLLLWPIDLAVLFAGVLLPCGTLYGAITTIIGFNHDVRPLPGWTLTSAGQAAVVAPLALLGLLLGAYLIALTAGTQAAFTRLVISHREGEDARLLELTRSRARLVDAFEAERRRIERDLHDGAQQQLVALTMTLGLARISDGETADGLLAKAQGQAKQALRDLRELIQGIHPQVLTDRGLPAAVADLADRATVPVTTVFELPARLPRPVESAAYFVVCEALANVAKHSGADRAEIRGWLAENRLVVEVCDNGGGGANASAGTGLAGLADRLSVIDGRLLVSSPPGGPTVLRAEIPVPLMGHAEAVEQQREPGRPGHGAGDDQPRGWVAHVEAEAEADAGSDHERRVVAVEVDQAALPEPVIVAVDSRGRRAGGAEGGDWQAVPALARAHRHRRQDEQPDDEGHGGQVSADAGRTVNVPGPQPGQQQGEVHQRDQRQHGPGERAEEPAVTPNGGRRVRHLDFRPGAEEEQQQPGPQGRDIHLAGDDADNRLGTSGADGADGGGRRDDRQRGNEPAYGKARRVGAPAGVGHHGLPQACEPALGFLDRDDLPAREQEAAELGGELYQQHDLRQPH